MPTPLEIVRTLREDVDKAEEMLEEYLIQHPMISDIMDKIEKAEYLCDFYSEHRFHPRDITSEVVEFEAKVLYSINPDFDEVADELLERIGITKDNPKYEDAHEIVLEYIESNADEFYWYYVEDYDFDMMLVGEKFHFLRPKFWGLTGRSGGYIAIDLGIDLSEFCDYEDYTQKYVVREVIDNVVSVLQNSILAGDTDEEIVEEFDSLITQGIEESNFYYGIENVEEIAKEVNVLSQLVEDFKNEWIKSWNSVDFWVDAFEPRLDYIRDFIEDRLGTVSGSVKRIKKHSKLSKIAQDIEIGVPEWKPGKAKILKDREKPPKYTPKRIILPTEPEKGKVVEVPTGKPEREGEKGIPPNIAKRIEELLNLMEDNEKRLDKLNKRLESRYKTFKKKIAPLEKEKKELEMSYEAIVKELFRLFHDNKLKIVKAKKALWTIKAQEEKTGRLTVSQAKKVLENLLEALEIENTKAKVLELIEEMMGTQLVIEINRIAEISEELSESESVEASIRLGISISDLWNKLKNLISSVVGIFKKAVDKMKDILVKSDEEVKALEEASKIVESA